MCNFLQTNSYFRSRTRDYLAPLLWINFFIIGSAKTLYGLLCFVLLTLQLRLIFVWIISYADTAELLFVYRVKIKIWLFCTATAKSTLKKGIKRLQKSLQC